MSYAAFCVCLALAASVLVIAAMTHLGVGA